jgi:hypothetical protein
MCIVDWGPLGHLERRCRKVWLVGEKRGLEHRESNGEGSSCGKLVTLGRWGGWGLEREVLRGRVVLLERLVEVVAVGGSSQVRTSSWSVGKLLEGVVVVVG